MGLFNRKKAEPEDNSADASGSGKKEKGSWRRPANTAFKQQRLKAWQPIFTPKTVLPTFFIIGIIFAPIGALLIWGSGLVTEITLDYTNCDSLTPSASSSQLTFSDMSDYTYRLRASESHAPFNPPQYAFVNDSNAANIAERQQCFIRFDIPYTLDPTVLPYYKLTNFYQNHRRYVKSLNTDQLKGDYVSPDDLQSGDCKPLARFENNTGKYAYYPCGLIANSVFNDTYSPLSLTTSENTNYTFSERGIAWPGEARKYTTKPNYNLSQIVPPPNWRSRFPNDYTEDNIPDLKNDEHFQNWMRTAGLPTFTKLWGRNDNDKLNQGRYQIVAFMNYPVKPYKGHKAIVISTVSWIGGKNPFLGWAYVAAASLFVALAVLGTIRHMIKPRKLGDMSLLSWNR